MRRKLVVVSLLLILFLLVGMGDAAAASRPMRGIHVQLVDMRGIDDVAPYRVRAVVYVRSEYNKAVQSAYVTAITTAPWGWPEYSTMRTDRQGKASWVLQADYSGAWTICVTNVSKVGYVYEWWKNQALCDTILYP